MVVYGFIIIISLFGNLLVFSVIIKTRRLHTITNLFIANLAFGDLLMTTFNIPFTVVSSLSYMLTFSTIHVKMWLCNFYEYQLLLFLLFVHAA